MCQRDYNHNIVAFNKTRCTPKSTASSIANSTLSGIRVCDEPCHFWTAHTFAALKHLITICFAGQSTEQLPIPRLTSSKPLRRGSNLPIFMDIRKSSNDRNFHRSLVVHKATYEPGLILPAVTAKVRLPTRKTDPPLALNFWTGKRSQIWCRRRVPRQLGDSPPDTKVCPDFGSQNKDPRRVARNK